MAGGQVMTFRTGVCLAVFLALAVAIGSATAPSRAQAVPPTEEADSPAMENEAGAKREDADLKDADIKDVDIKELDWSQLNVDASTLVTPRGELKPGLAPRSGANEPTWSSREQPNGSAVSVKQSISMFDDAKVGADMTLVRQPATLSELLSEKALNGGNEPQSGGTAWATITAPGVGSLWDKTAVEARLDPSQDQSKLGTSLSKSLELGEQYSLTLQNGYNLTQQGGVPVPGLAGHPSRNFETGQSAKLNLTDSGTSLSAGQSLSSTDDKWLRKIGAEQKLFGGVSVSGSISETPVGASNKSISGTFKQSW
jgi:uncharacterized protein YdeI (BOF family)